MSILNKICPITGENDKGIGFNMFNHLFLNSHHLDSQYIDDECRSLIALINHNYSKILRSTNVSVN